ncbi:hypothetical protein A3C57_01225 [Candidatus Nomurabacteria bacterium RIFCSPHIGHO2_02_FULL_33_12]|uniref:Ribulose-phosphate 3-epimerase n=1 Tax=Candidatus Nomurabacteria bacterium RIFCSPLOWO2_01_FULL_33_17 TaxID=1801764 RepID=A0A1F6WQE3_9BACT|nr:MAG: hypothetical protein A3C57_01225 [Candidatus Nomurabacteria bacterium RIFCSPHIGHO2_02_FULL_33_12]OGI84132.1 MAG: hypothetical protein A2903_02940 [Candidatus Nomurabacteria bacterium RIFCSPLOWO2_01_FULL_33_17]
MEIIPAIMPDSWHDLNQKMEMVLGGVKTVQLDLMDGKFVPGITWPFNGMHTESWKELMAENIGMPFWEDIDIEYDLMINDVESFWEQLIKMAPKRIVFHFPKDQVGIDKLKSFIKNLDSYFKNEMELGIAYEHDTHLSEILEIQDDIKFVQCMGIEHVGAQGLSLDEAVFVHIKAIQDRLSDMVITVDGAVNENTIERFINAGVERFVIGSAIYHNTNPMLALQDFKKMLQ